MGLFGSNISGEMNSYCIPCGGQIISSILLLKYDLNEFLTMIAHVFSCCGYVLHNALPFAFALLGFHSSSESLSEGITGEGHFDFLFLRIKSGIGAGKPVTIKPKFVILY